VQLFSTEMIQAHPEPVFVRVALCAFSSSAITFVLFNAQHTEVYTGIGFSHAFPPILVQLIPIPILVPNYTMPISIPIGILVRKW